MKRVIKYIIRLTDEKKMLEKFYTKILSDDIDGVIVMGAGTLKYDIRLNFAPYYSLLVSVAEKREIPVYINCIGVESKYNQFDSRCLEFVEALNNKAVKMITTRDDLVELNKYINNKEIVTDKISDIGTWASETYGIKKDDNSETVGFGVINPERFREFGRLEIYKQYEEYCIEMIEYFKANQIKWKIFNNGDVGDYKFAEKICKKLGEPIENRVVTPTNPKELVNIISGFYGIITSRLHSCIVAYSLNIPFIAISWNNKLQYFGKEIGLPKRIIGEEEFDKKIILERFNCAVEEGYDMEFKEKFRSTSKSYIEKYVDSIKEEMNK